MGRERCRLTKGKVLLIGLIVMMLGGAGYISLTSMGVENISAGIATQTLLIIIVIIWTGSYLFRVVTGQMTFMQQRRRYRKIYDQQSADELENKFNAMSEEEQQALLQRIGITEKDSKST